VSPDAVHGRTGTTDACSIAVDKTTLTPAAGGRAVYCVRAKKHAGESSDTARIISGRTASIACCRAWKSYFKRATGQISNPYYFQFRVPKLVARYYILPLYPRQCTRQGPRCVVAIGVQYLTDGVRD